MSTVQSPASSHVYSDQLSIRSTDEEGSPDFNYSNAASPPPINFTPVNGFSLTQTYLNQHTLSTDASIASSDVEYQNDSLHPSNYPSRPLSRSSTTSGMSITATKDGIEGKRLHRHGGNNYSYLLTNMFGNSNYSSFSNSNPTYTQSQLANNVNSRTNVDDDTSSANSSNTNGSVNSHPPNIPTSPPITLREKIQLLKTGSVPKRHHHQQPPKSPEELESNSSDNYNMSIGPVIVIDEDNNVHERDSGFQEESDYTRFKNGYR